MAAGRISRGLLAAIIVAIVVAAGGSYLYVQHLRSEGLPPGSYVIVKVYYYSNGKYIPLDNASLSASFFTYSANGSTQFGQAGPAVIHRGNAYYFNEAYLRPWAEGFISKYGPDVYKWMEPSVFFGIVYVINATNATYAVTDLVAVPINISYILLNRTFVINLTVYKYMTTTIRLPPSPPQPTSTASSTSSKGPG